MSAFWHCFWRRPVSLINFDLRSKFNLEQIFAPQSIINFDYKKLQENGKHKRYLQDLTNISGLGRLDNQISVANVPTKYFNKFVRFHESLVSIEVEIKILWDKETLLNRL